MSATTPLATVWDALETHGCGPHGLAYDFRARCAGHDGEGGDSLHVTEGADGRVLLHCFAHNCEPERILEPLGLGVADLFPAGHRHARRRRVEPVKRSDLTGNARVIANTLGALERLGVPWQATVTTDCPYCRSPGAYLRTTTNSEPFADCPAGCTTREFTQALAGRLLDQKATGQ